MKQADRKTRRNRQMKIKKVAALALAAVMGASMLAGCASKSIDEDAVVVFYGTVYPEYL